ncbi:hypothetical protein ACIQC5_05190 [Paenarthrobacter sp. NPDC092416]|uniref:hypothetical protein n=1 Tax=Paenarthrobacter sp. NPDC092416 TaxID=3364386 RepID=UPI00381415EA
MKPTSPEDLAQAIGLVIGAGDGTHYEATSTWMCGAQTEQHKISVHPRAFSWQGENVQTGERSSFDPATMRMRLGGEDSTLSLDRIPFSFPGFVKLAFPLSMAIWGRSGDDFRPIALEAAGAECVILLRHQTDIRLFGSLSFDRMTGRTTRLVLPTEVWHLA